MVRCHTSRLLLLMLLTAVLSGCGQKGPLYLQDETLSDQQQPLAIEQEVEEEVISTPRYGGSLIPSR